MVPISHALWLQQTGTLLDPARPGAASSVGMYEHCWVNNQRSLGCSCSGRRCFASLWLISVLWQNPSLGIQTHVRAWDSSISLLEGKMSQPITPV